METKGNPVDSVIQYQLHRKTEGGGSGDFEQIMIDNSGATIGDTIKWIYSDIKPIDFINLPFVDFYLYGEYTTEELGTVNVFEPRKVNVLMENDTGEYNIMFPADGDFLIDISYLLSNNINSNFINVEKTGAQ